MRRLRGIRKPPIVIAACGLAMRDTLVEYPMSVTQLHRRTFLRDTAGGMGLAALASLLGTGRASTQERPTTDQWRGIIRAPHSPPRAKRVIWLYMAGGPSHLESFDPKPRLAQLHGQPMPESYTRGQPIAQ